MLQDMKNICLKKGEPVMRYSHNMMAVKWQDKKQISPLTTLYDSVGVTTTKKLNIEEGNQSWNQKMYLITTEAWVELIRWINSLHRIL
jgi:hypothetical protein